jgi:hypothetical protein
MIHPTNRFRVREVFYHGMHVEEAPLLWQIFCHIRRTSSKCIRIGT